MSNSSSIMPRVSVMIPTYNYAHFLDDAIGSVLNQTYGDFELIIVDNASTDNTDHVVGKYLHDSRVRYYKNDTNLGLVGNWNKCLGYARGEFLKFLCADDKFRDTLLEKYVTLMDRFPKLAMVACNKQVFGPKDNYEVNLTLEHYHSGRDMNLHMLYGHQGVGEPTSVMFRKKDFEHIGFFTEKYQQYVDFDYWIKLLTRGDCYLVPEILVDIRFHPATVSNQIKNRKFKRCFEDYQIRKDVQQGMYEIDTSGTRIDEMVHKYAKVCVKLALLKTVPGLHRAPYRVAFRRAFSIAVKERLFKSTLTELLAGIKRITARKLSANAVSVRKVN